MDDGCCNQCHLPNNHKNPGYVHPCAASLSFLGCTCSSHRRVCLCHKTLRERAVDINKLMAINCALVFLRIAVVTLATVYSKGYAFPKTDEKDRAYVQRLVLCAMNIPSFPFGVFPLISQTVAVLLLATVRKFPGNFSHYPLQTAMSYDLSAVKAVNLCGILNQTAIFSSYPPVLQSAFTVYFSFWYHFLEVRDTELLEGQHRILLFILALETVGYLASHYCHQDTVALRTAILTKWYTDKTRACPGRRVPVPPEDVIQRVLVCCAENRY
ncbi:uncharacterized protein LOC129600771 [Paramacrobiotus metropolitanus]|uniref:uncharacterized protein LOC129600771 n=1 Tax=Paramacrobiotus metropolitanus TaxID=2943436 RepID=UPI002445E1C4|nr:uncharacterized protein LOC129600771 [Paramacrobiotus metropolitanus]